MSRARDKRTTGTLEIVRPSLSGGDPDVYVGKQAVLDAIQGWYRLSKRARGPARCAHCNCPIGPWTAIEPGAFAILALVPNDGLGDTPIAVCWYCAKKADAELLPSINRIARHMYLRLRVVLLANLHGAGDTA